MSLDIAIGITILGLLFLTAISTPRGFQDRTAKMQTASDARQVGQAILSGAAMGELPPVVDLHSPGSSHPYMTRGRLSNEFQDAWGVNLTSKNDLTVYANRNNDPTLFTVCVVARTDSGAVRAWTLWSSVNGGVYQSGTTPTNMTSTAHPDTDQNYYPLLCDLTTENLGGVYKTNPLFPTWCNDKGNSGTDDKGLCSGQVDTTTTSPSPSPTSDPTSGNNGNGGGSGK